MNSDTAILQPQPPKPNVSLHAVTSGSPAPGAGPRTAAQIILAYFLTFYRPVYKCGSTIRSADGRLVQMGVATSLCDSVLIAQLVAATDAPRRAGHDGLQGDVKLDGLPGLYRKWSKVAWGDMLNTLPDEDRVNEGVGAELVRDEFRRMVRDAMLTEITVGDTIGGQGVTQIERRPLIDWAYKFAKLGSWRDVRGKRCWFRLRDEGGGEMVLEVAVRHELFAQLRADPRLREMGANTFSRRSERFGVGTSTRKHRPEGQSAVKLSDEFVAELITGLSDDEVGADDGELVGKEGDTRTHA